jgi:hypothetical protein
MPLEVSGNVEPPANASAMQKIVVYMTQPFAVQIKAQHKRFTVIMDAFSSLVIALVFWTSVSLPLFNNKTH